MNFPQWLISNNGLKVVALIAASLIWLFVKGNRFHKKPDEASRD